MTTPGPEDSVGRDAARALYGPSRGVRAVYLRIMLAVTLGMGASMGMVRLFTEVNDVDGNTILSRVQEGRAALPRIVSEPEDLVMVFGSSMVDAGFSARQFDRELAEEGIVVKSFNFGFGGLNPLFQDYLSRRIRDAFQAKDRRLDLTLIEFVPFQATGSRYRGAVPAIDSIVTVLATPQEILDITLKDPARGVRMLNIRYLRDNISAELITGELGRGFGGGRPRSSLPVDEAIVERRREIGEILNQKFEEDYPDYGGEDWHYPWQGAGTIPEERDPSTVELIKEFHTTSRTDHRMDADRLRRISCCDIEELHFEEILVASFIEVVKNFQEFSDHVEVVLLPQNTDWIHYPPEAQQRLAEVLDRIARETGAPIRNDQLLETITPEMFRDTTHLSRYEGDVAYTTHLVTQYAPLLREE